MLNANVEIKKWFFNNIDSLGMQVAVFDGFAPDYAANEYIIMTGRTSSQEQGKSGYTNNCTIVLDIVTKSANFGYKRSEEISNLILTDINSDTIINLGTGWDASSLSVESIRNLDGLSPLDNVFRTIITYNIIITQI
jgi:hypothetical protein